MYAAPLLYWFAKAFELEFKSAKRVRPQSISENHTRIQSVVASALPPLSEYRGEKYSTFRCLVFTNVSAAVADATVQEQFVNFDDDKVKYVQAEMRLHVPARAC